MAREKRMVEIQYMKDGSPIKNPVKKQGRNEPCLACGSGLKIKQCNCNYANYCNGKPQIKQDVLPADNSN